MAQAHADKNADTEEAEWFYAEFRVGAARFFSCAIRLYYD